MGSLLKMFLSILNKKGLSLNYFSRIVCKAIPGSCAKPLKAASRPLENTSSEGRVQSSEEKFLLLLAILCDLCLGAPLRYIGFQQP